jgi:hypothetical protein
MLELKTVQANLIIEAFLWNGLYSVEDGGVLMPRAGYPKTPLQRTSHPLEITSCKYGGDTSPDFDFHPSIRSFIEAMKRRGMKPEYESNEDGPNFTFYFDVSSKLNEAYYSLCTGNHGQEIMAHVHAIAFDPVILTNVQLADAFLAKMLNECHVRKFK